MLNDTTLVSAGIALSFMALGLAACESAPGRGNAAPAFTTADSAGVRIAHSEEPAWGPDGGGWSLSDEPVVEIGTADGEEAYALFGVYGATRLPDGRIAVANAGTDQIRIYGEDGAHLGDLGRSGEGPGEFSLLRGLWSRGDSIVAADNRLQRVTVFGPDGETVRTIPITPADGASQVFPLGSFDDGTLLVAGLVPPGEAPREGLFDGGARVFHRYSADGEPLARIGEVPQPPNWGFSLQGGVGYTQAPLHVYPPPHALDGGAVYFSTGRRFQLEERSPAGNLLRIVRWSGEERPVTDEVVDRFRRVRLDGADDPEARRRQEAVLEGMSYPDVIPAYESLLVDAEGHLWVERYRAPWEEERRWWIFDPEGRWLGEGPVPGDLDVFEVGADYVLGVRRDEHDVERVALYRLDRGS